MDPVDPTNPMDPKDRSAGAATCYRHPDRETGIRCTRCKRPICPDCMVSASVGFQCPDCVRQGASAASVAPGAGVAGAGGGRGEDGSTGASRWSRLASRGRSDSRPRTLTGGVVARDPRMVTKILIVLNLAVFLLIKVAPDPDRLLSDLVMIGSWPPPQYGSATEGVASGEWYRLLTSVFLHQEYLHIGLNMLSLWFLGGPVEAAFGRVRFLAVYLLAGLGGSVLSYLLADPNTASLGASGAIFGLFGATGVLIRKIRADFRPFAALLVINLIITFQWSGIAWQAHVGGLVVGALVGLAFVYAPRERRALVQWGSCGLALLVMLGAVLVRTAMLT